MMQPTKPIEPEIVWTVSLERANMILSILAKQSFEIISPIMDDLRSQATAQIQQLQQGAALPGMSRPNGEAASAP